jgi:uncharacterized protein
LVRSLLALVVTVAITGCERSDSVAKPTASGLISVDAKDAAMQAAMQKARDHFPEFWKTITDDRKRTVPIHGDALVKAYFVDANKPDAGEHMWVSEVEYDGKIISGTLVDAPEYVRSVKANQKVSFPLERLSDWLYIQDGKAVGAFTVKLLRTRMSDKDRNLHDSNYPFRFD